MIEELKSLDELVAEAEKQGKTISALTLELQAASMKTTQEALTQKMHETLLIMRQSAENGMLETASPSGLSGGVAKKMAESQAGLLGDVAQKAVTYALAIAEHNACMGKIIAAPTAGSCGILPGILLALGECKDLSDDELVRGLFNAGAVGMVIAQNASLSGAQGGCAAECGSAGAMAACAVTELLGGTPTQCAHACAIAIKAIMGLVCDPVAGLVEVPCVKRNATGAAIALTAAEMALAGIESALPADQVIGAMKSVGCMMHESLRETSQGGLAATKTAREIEKRLRSK
ncbi:MAG: L-serine ammonia-lyase, iron-sulfur-dependent, subunit alpha [Clostridia bacterium]|nr:L-serine ammonia-lyase, iron-sulfur-dependent, subunit alpha [Clostridia bacterium]